MFVENFSKFVDCYGKDRKLKLLGFFILSLIVGSLEFIGIALVYPFILLILNPSRAMHTRFYIHFPNVSHLHCILFNAFILGLIAIGLFILKSLFMMLSIYLQNKFITNWKFSISKKFMQYYLYSSYKNSLETAPSEKIYNLTSLIGQTFDGFIFRIMDLITNITIVFIILILLFMKFFLAAVITSLFIISSMIFHNRFFKNKINKISQTLFKLSVITNQKTMGSINNIKDIKILSAEDYFYKGYLTAQKNYNDVLFENNFYGGISPYFIEMLGILSLVILAGIISIQNINNTSWMLASYGVVVAVIFRILPCLNRIQSSLNSINISRDFVKTILAEASKFKSAFIEEKSDIKVKFDKYIKLDNISFAYKKESVIKNLTLEIKKGEFVGIIGLSGAGKTTLADIIMGLLPVDSGKIFVDDVEFNQQNYNVLRRLIGYVPQQVSILGGSFKINVAWGMDEEDIDDEKVKNVLKLSQLEDFVNKFDEGIDSNVIVGSNGLSQGQKQRLAIARALYRDSKILIFDEATSSLDVETEYEITKMLNALKGEKTIIAIAHRLSTLKSCDRLIYLKDGKIVDTGTFEELSNKYKDFEKLIKLSSLSNC